jgi:hypothetical protein
MAGWRTTTSSTTTGASVDDNGRFVDNGRYKLTNDYTIVFPNSRNETFPPVSASAMI